MAETNQANKHTQKNKTPDFKKESVHCCLTLKIKIKNVGLVLHYLHIHLKLMSQSSVSKTFFFNSFGALNPD